MNLLHNYFHLAVIEYLYRGHRAKFGKIMQNKGHYVAQGHSRSQIWVPIEDSYATPY